MCKRSRVQSWVGIFFISILPNALNIHCKCRDDYDFFSYGQYTFMQYYRIALNKRLFSAPVHNGKLIYYLSLDTFHFYL